MSNTWKNKVLPKIKKFLDKGKKKGAAEICKNFDKSKESLDKEFEEKEADLSPKVVEIYRSSSTIIDKQLLKKPSEAGVKENPAVVQGLLQELVKAGFPGARAICDAGEKYGPASVAGPIVYLLEKASAYLSEEPWAEEEKTREMAVGEGNAAEAETAAATPAIASAAAEEEKQEIPKQVDEPAIAALPPAPAEDAFAPAPSAAAAEPSPAAHDASAEG